MSLSIEILSGSNPVFPSINNADRSGLLAVGGNLNPETLKEAYRNGIFPWYEEGQPIMWYSPDPRLILFPDKLRISKSLYSSIRKYEFRFNTCFEKVIENCAEVYRKMQAGTWITQEMIQAYKVLHSLGHVYSFETFFHGNLVGGLYGVKVGGIFVGESMFHLMPDASKVALFYLCDTIKNSGFDFVDCQTETSHLISLGAELVSRKRYIEMLAVSSNIECKFQI